MIMGSKPPAVLEGGRGVKGGGGAEGRNGSGP